MPVRSAGSRVDGCGKLSLAGPYLDGELPPGWKSKYERHLTGCLSCRAEVRTLRRLSQLLQAWGPPGPWETGLEDEPLAVRSRARRKSRGPAANPAATTFTTELALGGGSCGRP